MQHKDQLITTAKAMMAQGKGLLAADESSDNIAKRFAAVNLENTENNRREYRQMLLTTEGVEDYLSGVILFDETIHQQADNGTSFAEALAKKGIVPGIKVDKGAKPLALHDSEMVTEGLDGLRERFAEYYQLGARFAKWRGVYTIIGDDKPSTACQEANAGALARYAALAQEAGIVPIVEPEVLIDGKHSIERCYEVTAQTLDALFAALKTQGVMLEGLILKTSMVISGKEATGRADVQTVAEQTIKCLKEHVPTNIGGIVFLSGGQSEVESTAHLNAMHQLGELPWGLTFSYSRAIQNPVLQLWAQGERDKAREAYLYRCKANALAAQGQWTEEYETSKPY